MDRRTQSTALSLAAVYLIWSSTYLAIRYVVEALPPLLSSGLRYVAAAAILYTLARLSGTRAPTRAEWRAAVPTGILLCVTGNGFVAMAERDVSSGLAAMVCAAMPIFACLFEALSGVRPSIGEWLGVVLGFLGVVLIGVGDLRAQPLAAVLLCIAPVGWALGSVLTRRWPRAPGAMSAASQLLCGGIANTVIALAVGERWPAAAPLRAWGAWVYLILFGTVIAFRAYNHLLATTRTAVATSYAYVNPVLALALGAALGGEHFSKNVYLAGALVVGGVALVVNASRR